MSAFTTYSARTEFDTATRRRTDAAMLTEIQDRFGDETPVSGDMLAVLARSTQPTARVRERRLRRVRLIEKSEGCIG
ncbi:MULTISPECIES: hypothetical protein [unclassified Leucobacter]|uniref:hypothetical protein n=1 Tax=unclassified Leucobacter TaxID=2621730 RepID=UPI000621F642|nr:hypothetical protein [Leucobacter sp. Ag1]KKI19659.1 hypothetical protein XM48_09345 [Leucobacter sp. Ag1]